MNVIKAERVKKSFGDIEALKNIGLEVEKGEIVGILGSNGAGKSTLVNILTGQIERDKGEVEVMGMDPSCGKKLREKLGILPEREDPPSFLTGEEYLEFVSDVRDVPIDSNQWVEKLNLEGKMDKVTMDLSKGERQKLMVAQAFFHEPDLVFVDEPLVNLDPVIQEKVKTLFREHKEREKSIVLCTHVISLAEEVCDRVLFLEDGKITNQVEETENLKERFLKSQ